MTAKLIILPERATLPEDIHLKVLSSGDILGKLAAGAESETAVTLSVRELQLLTEYRDILDVEMRAVVGIPGGMYNTVWNTYVASLPRITVDNLRHEQGEVNNSLAVAGQDMTHTREDRARNVRQRGSESSVWNQASKEEETDADASNIS